MAVILLADDERAVRTGMRRFLESEGFTVEVAKDGIEAVEKFAAIRPDLVLMDVMMPKCNGFTACTEIRRIDPAVPVVFLTALDSEADLVRGFSLGADDYVSKSSGQGEQLARITQDEQAPSADLGAPLGNGKVGAHVHGKKKQREPPLAAKVAHGRGKRFGKRGKVAALAKEQKQPIFGKIPFFLLQSGGKILSFLRMKREVRRI